MSDDLHRAVQAELDAHEPAPTPSFDAILDRKRTRDRRRGGAALAATALAVAGVAFVPTALGGSAGSGGGTGQVAQGRSAERFGYYVTADGPEATSKGSEDALQRCLSLPGLSDGITLNSLPAQYSGTVTGRDEADAFVACVEAVPGRAVDLNAKREPGLSVDPLAPPAEPAVWDVDPSRPPSPDSRTFTALVQRLGCASGETGDVLDPSLRETDSKVEVTFTVAGLTGTGAAFCTVNKPVPVEVELDEPLGNRTLVDGTCSEAPAKTTSLCLVPQRWPLPTHTAGGARALTPAQQAFVESCVGAETALPVPNSVGQPESVLSTIDLDGPVRIVGRDGKCLGRTRDRQDNRINLIVEDGTVIWAGRF